MKKIVKIIMIILAVSVISPVASGMSRSRREEIINRIREDYAITNEDIDFFKVRTVKIKSSHRTDYLSPGDTVRFYTEDGILRKIITFRHLEGEKIVTEYYIKNGNPYFIAETVTEIEGEKLENPLMSRYYFSPDKKLVRAINNGVINDNNELGEIGADIMEVYNEVKKVK